MGDPGQIVQASRALADGRDLLVDFNHDTDKPAGEGQPAKGGPAAAWISELEARSTGVWGRVAFTPAGAQAVRLKEYRYLSPVFGHDKQGNVTCLIRAALTNNPALTLTALASAFAPSTSSETHLKPEELVRIRAQLGLAESADADAILARCAAAIANEGTLESVRTKLGITDATADVCAVIDGKLSELATASAQSDPTQFVPRAEFDRVSSALASAISTGEATSVAEDVRVAIAAGKLAPASEKWALGYRKKDPEGFAHFVANAAVIGAAKDSPAKASAPGGGVSALSDEEIAVCAQLGLAEKDFAQTKSTNAH
jgi:phage I-like protein